MGLTVNLILVDSDVDSLGTELIDSFTFSHEHDLQSGSLWVVVNVLSELLIDEVILDRDVYGDSLLELDNVLLECFDFGFSILQLF
jgi:hypothetical protein